jgi:hypothetical protein
MMNLLLRNPANRKAKSPCHKNIRYPVCVPGHDSPNGNTFLTIVLYDKQKTTLVDDPSDLINTRRLIQAESPSTVLVQRQSTRVIRSLGSSTGIRVIFLLVVHQKKWNNFMLIFNFCEGKFQVTSTTKCGFL